MTALVVSSQNGPALSFIPEQHQADFVDMVFQLYATNAEAPSKHKNGKEYTDIPDVVMEIAYANHDFFIIGAAAYDEENPRAFDERLAEAGDEEELKDLLDDMHAEYGDERYHYLFEQYVEDVVAVCEFYHLTHFTSLNNPFVYMGRYYELHNYPIISVW